MTQDYKSKGEKETKTGWEWMFDKEFVQDIGDGTKVVAFLGSNDGEKYYDFWRDYKIKNFITSLLSQTKEEENKQKHYELAMLAQKIDFYISKDGEEYGVTPLHQKLHAFISKLKDI